MDIIASRLERLAFWTTVDKDNRVRLECDLYNQSNSQN